MSRTMRKLINMILAALITVLTAASCQKEWKSAIELAVNDTRININTTDEGTFTLPVYSGLSWTMSLIQGEDWLAPGNFSAEGMKYIEFIYSANADTKARVAKVQLTASSGKEIIVYVIQNGMVQKASELTEFDIL